jgi:DNA-binding transcriptional LysR family regulator
MHPAIDARLQHHAVVLAEVLNFSEAAKRLHIAQPALSKSIQQLEEYLGLPLFRRTSRKVELTEAGQRFVEEARKALHHAQRAVEAVNPQEAAETVVLGYPPQFNSRFIQDLRTIVIPGTALEVVTQGSFSAEIVEKLSKGEWDCGILGMPDQYPQIADLKMVSLLRYPLKAAIPDRHKLAVKEELRLTDLADQPLIFPAKEQSPALHSWFASRCRAAGFSPRIERQVKDPHDFSSMIFHGLGIGIGVGLAKDCQVHRLPENVTVRTFVEPELVIETAMILGERFNSAPLKPFIAAVQQLRHKYLHERKLSPSA